MTAATAEGADPRVGDAARVDASGVSEASLAGLRRWNGGLAVLHGAQAIAVLALSSSFAIDITSSFPTGAPGSPQPAPEQLLSVAVGPAIAAFLFLAAIDHGLSATALRGRYEADLRRGINRMRWIEYSVSATIMILLIAAYTGITGISAMIAIAGANVAMILFGWLQERDNPPGRSSTTMLAFWFGTAAGLAPWIAIAVNIVGSETVPGFVLGIFGSLLVFFSSFAVNQWLQYREVGRWRSYAYGEKAYLVLSLVAKSALAWQIFGGSLAG
jgi:Heliorhodopsin